MELPKNITQIGEANPSCKIYLEDYVASYIKQLNIHAECKPIAVALYGLKKEEAGVIYLFIYGTYKLNFLQKENRHLSQAVLQEAEKGRKKYFPTYSFLGCKVLNGEMIEGFQIYDQGACRFVSGYAYFYEKNDCMLQLMLEERQEVKPEEINQEKYEVVKRRQEERKQQEKQNADRHFYHKNLTKKQNQAPRVRYAAATILGLVCVAGILTVSNEKRLQEITESAKNMVTELWTKRLPDAMEVAGNVETESLELQGEFWEDRENGKAGMVVAEKELTEAIRKENEIVNFESDENNASYIDESALTENTESEANAKENAKESDPGNAQEHSAENNTEMAQEERPDASEESADEQESKSSVPTSYIVCRGDTLIGICTKKYGDDQRVGEICDLNEIENPDDIKVGDKILLPQ